jgi:hypothetical protein
MHPREGTFPSFGTSEELTAAMVKASSHGLYDFT